MHAYLIIGGSQKDRQDRILELLTRWQADRFDTVEIGDGETTIGISDIREFTRRIQLLPQFGKLTAGIIHSGETLTEVAQQALLKTLEEPPVHTRVIIEAETDRSLLSTVISRTVVDRVRDQGSAESAAVSDHLTFFKLLSMTPGKRLAALEPYAKSRDSATSFVRNLITAIHSTLVSPETKDKAGYSGTVRRALPACRTLLTAMQYLGGNVTPSLVLDAVFFRFNDGDITNPEALDMP